MGRYKGGGGGSKPPALPTSAGLFCVDPGSLNYLQFNVKSAFMFRTLKGHTKSASTNCAKIKR